MAKHGVIYILNNKTRDGENVFKVGETYDPDKRVVDLNNETSNIGKFEIKAMFPVSDTLRAEKDCFKELARLRIQDNREFFKGNLEEITNIVKNVTSKYKPVTICPEYPKKIYLIDGSSYIFRAYFGIRQFLSTSKGFPTNALYGFINMLQKVVKDEKPDYLCVAFDSKEKTFRHDIYSDYKANRDVPPEDLAKQFPYFEPLVDAFNISSIRIPGYEADDIIGTLALKGSNAGFRVVIVSGDKDMMQLVSPEVQMLDTMKNKWIGIDEVKEKFGVPPEKVTEVMGLMGDSSDHIPGVKGVGLKTATALIQKYGSIEGLYESVDEIGNKKLKEKLVLDKEKALLSRRLSTIDTKMDLEFNADLMGLREIDRDKLKKLFEEFEFANLLSSLEKDN